MSKLNLTLQPTRTATLVKVFAMALLASAIVLLPTVAHADSNSAYQVSGTMASGGTFSGTLDFHYNSLTSQTSLINSNLTVDGISYTCNGATGNQCVVFDPSGTDYFEVENGNNLVLLKWTPFNPSGPYPSTLNFVGGYVQIVNVKTTDTVLGGTGKYVAAPEPSALLMLGAGLLGLLAMYSRRRLNAGSIA
jgi:hypothetical protein